MRCNRCIHFNSSMDPADPRSYECFWCELEKLFMSEYLRDSEERPYYIEVNNTI